MPRSSVPVSSSMVTAVPLADTAAWKSLPASFSVIAGVPALVKPALPPAVMPAWARSWVIAPPAVTSSVVFEDKVPSATAPPVVMSIAPPVEVMEFAPCSNVPELAPSSATNVTSPLTLTASLSVRLPDASASRLVVTADASSVNAWLFTIMASVPVRATVPLNSLAEFRVIALAPALIVDVPVTSSTVPAFWLIVPPAVTPSVVPAVTLPNVTAPLPEVMSTEELVETRETLVRLISPPRPTVSKTMPPAPLVVMENALPPTLVMELLPPAAPG